MIKIWGSSDSAMVNGIMELVPTVNAEMRVFIGTWALSNIANAIPSLRDN